MTSLCCNFCGSKTEVIYRVLNIDNEYGDRLFNSLEEAENYYEEIAQAESSLAWHLYEDIYCPECEHAEVNQIKGE